MIQFIKTITGHEVIIIDVFSIKAISETSINTNGTAIQTVCTDIFGDNYCFQVEGSMKRIRTAIVLEIDRRNKAAL